MPGERFAYRDDADATYVGWLARPAQANGAALLIAHGAPGISDHEREIADRLAGMGYIALAADYHGDGMQPDGTTLATRMAEWAADPRPLRARLRAALDALRSCEGVAADRVATIGYCYGGYAVLELARGGADVAATAAFHALLPTERPADARNIRGSVLIQNGTDDPYAPPDMRLAFERQMDAAGADWRMVLYGGTPHAFTMARAADFAKPKIAHHPASDRRSWQALLAFLQEMVGAA